MMYYDSENDTLYTMEELMEIFIETETESNTFEEWLLNSMAYNGGTLMSTQDVYNASLPWSPYTEDQQEDYKAIYAEMVQEQNREEIV